MAEEIAEKRQAVPKVGGRQVEEEGDKLPSGTDNVVRFPGGRPAPVKTEAGNWVHNNFEQIEDIIAPAAGKLTTTPLPPGARLPAEQRVPDTRLPTASRPRMDRVDYVNGIVYEIKPEQRRAQGLAEARLYAEDMDRFEPLPGGRKWGAQVLTYDAGKVIQFLKDRGYLR